MEEMCFPDPEIDKMRLENDKHTTFLKHLEAKLTKTQKSIEMLEKSKRKIADEIEEREEKRKRLYVQAMERDSILKEKWKDLSMRYGFPLDTRFSLMTLLPIDVLIHIISFVPIQDILSSLNSVSKAFHEIIQLNSLWHNLYDIRWKKVKIPPISSQAINGDKEWRSIFVQKYRLESNWKHGRCRTSVIEHRGMVSCIDFVNDTLVTGSPDKVVRIWDLKTLTCINSLESHAGGVECLQLDLHSNRLVTGSRDGTIKVWDISKPKGEELLATLTSGLYGVISLQFEGSTLIAGLGSGNIVVWDMHTGTSTQTLTGHGKFITTLQLRGKQLISGSRDRSIKIWDLSSSGSEVNTIRTLSSVEKIQWKDDLLMNIDEKSIHAISLSTLAKQAEYQGHTQWVRSLQFKKNMMISASEDKTLKVWNVAEAKAECTLTGHQGIVNCLKFDVHRLVSGSSDRTVRIWDFL